MLARILIIGVLDSWQADLGATLVQSHTTCIPRMLLPSVEVGLCDVLEVLAALAGWIQILLPSVAKALICDRVGQFLPSIAIASAVVQVRIDVRSYLPARWAILPVDHEIILGWRQLEL